LVSLETLRALVGMYLVSGDDVFDRKDPSLDSPSEAVKLNEKSVFLVLPFEAARFFSGD
jgi:hypothetical protein